MIFQKSFNLGLNYSNVIEAFICTVIPCFGKEVQNVICTSVIL